jgi:hypothetical protein
MRLLSLALVAVALVACGKSEKGDGAPANANGAVAGAAAAVVLPVAAGPRFTCEAAWTFPPSDKSYSGSGDTEQAAIADARTACVLGQALPDWRKICQGAPHGVRCFDKEAPLPPKPEPIAENCVGAVPKNARLVAGNPVRMERKSTGISQVHVPASQIHKLARTYCYANDGYAAGPCKWTGQKTNSCDIQWAWPDAITNEWCLTKTQACLGVILYNESDNRWREWQVVAELKPGETIVYDDPTREAANAGYLDRFDKSFRR